MLDNTDQINREDNYPDFQDDDFLNSKTIENEFKNDLLNHALHYARVGFPVLPVHSLISKDGIYRCSCRGWKVCEKQGKHPRTINGCNAATTDENKIIEWWEKYPKANIGLLTGLAASILVLDVDPKNGGFYSLEELEDYHRQNSLEKGIPFEPLPPTLTVITGSGGRHYYFKYPSPSNYGLDDSTPFQIQGSVSKIGKSLGCNEGLDIRANGNFVVAPPSNHLSGGTYAWLGVNTLIEDAPKWLIHEIFKAEAEDASDLSNASGSSTNKFNGEKIKDGEGRYDFLWRYICGLVNNRTKEEVLRLALEMNQKRFKPPKDEKVVIYQVEYLYNRYGNGKGKKSG